jgi:uncharacterized membrane protein
MALALVATVCAGIFAGAAMYITLVEHPARLSCGTALAIREFGPSYRRATVMQGLLAFVGMFAALDVWWQSRDVQFLAGGLLLGAVVPFTLVVIAPTNRDLTAAALEPESEQALRLLHRWGRLHAVRTVLSAAAFVVLLLNVAGG